MQTLNTGYQRAGKNSRVQINATNLKKARWNVNENLEEIDTVNFESGGYDEGIGGISGCDWSLGGLWDANKNAFDDPPGLYPRDDLATLRFYENVTDNVRWSFTYARVRSATNGAEVRQGVTFESSGKSQGSFTRPTGSV